ncbi:hypothetical protein LguiB_001866 [Lonicera macranthoides]
MVSFLGAFDETTLRIEQYHGQKLRYITIVHEELGFDSSNQQSQHPLCQMVPFWILSEFRKQQSCEDEGRNIYIYFYCSITPNFAHNRRKSIVIRYSPS